MKLHVLSDLHLEFAPHLADEDAAKAADAIILAGDIYTGVQGIQWARQSFPNKPIVYVSGNHEFYGNHWDLLLDQLRKKAQIQEVHFLENESVAIAGIRFLGATLWTDFDYFGRGKRHASMLAAEAGLNDFKRINAKTVLPADVSRILSTSDGKPRPVHWTRKLTAVHTLERNQVSMAWLKAELPKGDPEKTVVVTHHYPHKNSCAPKWANDLMNAAFGSDLPLDVLLGATLWVHGHTHDSFDYQVKSAERSVRVVCNPRGYPPSCSRNTWENAFFNPAFIVEIA